MPNEKVGVPPCPNCGAPLIPDVKCENCGYKPKATSCERCGTRFDGDKCDLCGWSNKAPICRNCGADLTDNHIMLKTLIDKWVWKTCAYCGTPIEQWLYTILGEIEEYIEAYEYHPSRFSGVEFLESAIGLIIIIFVIAAFLPPLANLSGGTTGFTPNANVTSGPNMGPVLQLYPLFFVVFGLLIIVAFAAKKI